jgi:hypothetical protein
MVGKLSSGALTFTGRTLVLLSTGLAACGIAMSGCSSDKSAGAPSPDGGVGGSSSGGGPGSGGTCAAPGGPATGAADVHCKEADGGMITQVTGVCEPLCADGGLPPPLDAGPVLSSDYGATMFGVAGFDDDCKYKVAWSSTPICDGNDVTFTVTASKTVGGDALTGAKPYIEYYKIEAGGQLHFSSVQPIQAPTEKPGGIYDIGPLAFDEAGQWTIRFHFNEDCCDDPANSPHGHAAFFIDVP